MFFLDDATITEVKLMVHLLMNMHKLKKINKNCPSRGVKALEGCAADALQY